jgi:hypothetical protein
MLLGEAKTGGPGSGGASPSYGVYLRRVCVNLPLILALSVDLDLARSEFASRVCPFSISEDAGYIQQGARKRTVTPMGMFNDLMSKIFGHPSATPSAAATPPGTTIEAATAPSGTTPAASAVAPATAAPAATSDAPAVPVQIVDVTSILDGLAAKNSEKLDWKKSIVDHERMAS